MLLRLLIYMGMLGLGIMFGFHNLTHPKLEKVLSELQLLSLIGLLFVMGIRIGADPKVADSLSTIGFQALFLAMGSIVFSVTFVFIGRHILKIDKGGMPK